jgi:hypothetical protein
MAHKWSEITHKRRAADPRNSQPEGELSMRCILATHNYWSGQWYVKQPCLTVPGGFDHTAVFEDATVFPSSVAAVFAVKNRPSKDTSGKPQAQYVLIPVEVTPPTPPTPTIRRLI